MLSDRQISWSETTIWAGGLKRIDLVQTGVCLLGTDSRPAGSDRFSGSPSLFVVAVAFRGRRR